jgi:hypothetical protein
MPVNARRLIRKMRGGAQAHLIEADDGRFYVVKFQNNPQHRRILVNEMIASVFLEYLQIKSPESAVIHLDEAFLQANPEVHIQLGNARSAVVPGWHFGSCFPGDPATVAVYDFVPDTLLHQTANIAEFVGMLIFDKWTANADARQSIFIRTRLREYAPEFADHPLRVGFVALMIDHGFIFNGPHWDFPDSPLQGLYFRPTVYHRVHGWEDFQPWLDQVIHFPEEIVDRAFKRIPAEWITGDEAHLETLLETLLRRRKRVADLVSGCRRGRINPFPNWK